MTTPSNMVTQITTVNFIFMGPCIMNQIE